MTISDYDNQKTRCRMLGHEIGFDYCRSGASGRPCRKIFDCWFEKFDIQQFMTTHYTPEEIASILTPPKPKMLSLVELIQQARDNAQNKPKE